jgi:hypothetical protein
VVLPFSEPGPEGNQGRNGMCDVLDVPDQD